MFLTRRQRRSVHRSFKLVGIIISGIISVMVFNYKSIRKIVKYIKNYYHFRKIDYNFNQIQKLILKMNGFQFEVFCKGLYKALGYKVKCTPPGQDYGRDLILNDKIFVECKHYTSNGLQISRVICQKLIGSMEAFNIKEGIVITTGKVHENAYEYATRLNRLGNKHLHIIK